VLAGMLGKQSARNMIGIDNFRLPNTNVQQFLDYGVGSHGLYISFDKDTDEPLSVRLLSRPAMNKNVSSFQLWWKPSRGLPKRSPIIFVCRMV
jgi:hypothetical protein